VAVVLSWLIDFVVGALAGRSWATMLALLSIGLLLAAVAVAAILWATHAL
jgi:hypothetical protein